MFNLQPTLISTLLTLRPLEAKDFDALFAVASDPLIWEVHPAKDRWKRDVFEKLFKDSLDSHGAMVVIDNQTQKIIGSSRFYELDLSNSVVVIGYTFLARDYWGGAFNRVLKSMMLDHAFKYVDQVHFHVHVDNVRSRRAMEKIGGQLISQNGDRVVFCLKK